MTASLMHDVAGQVAADPTALIAKQKGSTCMRAG
jgi:hypothetical protein